MPHLLLGNKKRASDANLEVDLHDGEDGGIVMDVHRRHRGNVTHQMCHSFIVFICSYFISLLFTLRTRH
jgi:hypothetical protein